MLQTCYKFWIVFRARITNQEFLGSRKVSCEFWGGILKIRLGTKYECHPFIHILTLNVLLSNTGQLIGNAQSNNCQNFIVAILQSNNMAKIRISFLRNNPRKDYFQHLYGKSRILFSQILQKPQISLDKLEILNRIQSIDIAIMS